MCSLAAQNGAKEFRGSLIGALSERSMFTSTDHCPSIAISNQYVSVSSIVLRNNDVSLANLLLSSYCFAPRHDLATHTAGFFFFLLCHVSLICANAECCLPCLSARALRPFSLVLLQCEASDVTAWLPRFLRRALKFRSILSVFLFFFSFVSFSSSTLTCLYAPALQRLCGMAATELPVYTADVTSITGLRNTSRLYAVVASEGQRWSTCVWLRCFRGQTPENVFGNEVDGVDEQGADDVKQKKGFCRATLASTERFKR